MAKINLNTSLIKAATCPPEKKKLEFSDTVTPGLILEIRAPAARTFLFRYRDQRGTQRQRVIGATDSISLAAARKIAQDWRIKIILGTDPADEKAALRAIPTFAEFIAERYLPFVKGYKRSWNSDECYLRHHILPALGKKYLDEITKQDIISLHHGMRTRGYALGTCNRVLILVRYALNLTLRWEIPGVKANPTHGVPLFEDHAGKKERFLTKSEVQRLYDAVRASDNPMLRFIIPMLILTGARKREVLDAKWEDLDLPRRNWRIPTTKAGRPRHVPLSDGVLKLLTSVPRNDDCPWVFANPKTRKPYCSFYYSWDTARKQGDLADVRIHDLRHSFASFLVNAGRSLYEVQKILGHTQVKTTQRYAHLAHETLLDAANAAMNAIGEDNCPSMPSVTAVANTTPALPA